ncbi:MAG TPA: nucleotidyltransferase family protein [Anaerolineales bacterium]|nr:nucleotidyltransferase family protein [Anaerolineales bacterium]HLO29535.1 nucleotidyltransferase family protein [Anaerolineales bacterium]
MISAIILAAGASKRMGQPKMLLPWGKLTVIEHVLRTYLNGELEDILVVTGGARDQVEQAIGKYPVRKIHNKDYATGEMLSSLQCALRGMPDQTQAALIGLGDQPQVQEESVRLLCKTYRETGSRLIVPSFQMRRGHPWLVARPLWHEILELKPPQSPRDFLNGHADEIHYVSVSTPSVLADLDTPEDYRKSHP